RNSPHVWAADSSVCVGPPPPALSYLNGAALIEAARGTGCDAVYPGYGFLSEKGPFAANCREEGLTFIGPSPEAISAMGDKVEARRIAKANGVPVVPGSSQGFTDVEKAAALAKDIGFPLLLKASGGGGGRGMRVVTGMTDFAPLFTQASAEAGAAFGNPEIYLERFFSKVRHIEIQVFGDRHGNAVHLWERDCSIQRRHQKLVEEAPSPVLPAKTRQEMAEAAVTLVRNLKYEGAGTIEFIFDLDSGKWFFIEMNTRIQVEHPVTEEIFGVDLVAEQLRVAAGEPISFKQPAPPIGRSAIEFRINAEDPENGFRPSPGLITEWSPPDGQGIRLDSHVYQSYAVPPFYDSLLGKLIVSGRDRGEVLAAAASALARFHVSGIATTIPFHAKLVGCKPFIDGSAHTRWVEQEMA
ncbi:MAG TPA: biotin carboxylase N-terminal domain-containing protein, partial [Hyphomicrobiaceae bacterium]|nr:biotin carboxylase N-terminal domain-containing protein [Hyphomicrobiaceae bacterium]